MRFRRETDWGEFKRSDLDELSRVFRRKPERVDPWDARTSAKAVFDVDETLC